jgi:hypothetical protein
MASRSGAAEAGIARVRLTVPQVVQLAARTFGGAAETRFPPDRSNGRRIVSRWDRTQIFEELSCFGFADGPVAEDPHDQDSCPAAKLDLDAVSDIQGPMCLRDPAVHSHPAKVAGTGSLGPGLEDPRYLKPLVEANDHVSRV